MPDPTFTWRGAVDSAAVNRLHGDAFGHEPFDDDWEGLVHRHSLGWVTAYEGDELVGFTNVVWDGLTHAWLQDVIVAARAQRRGIGQAMVEMAATEAAAAGCEWLHVDFEDDLAPFYLEACGFQPAAAGLRYLR